MIGSEKQVKWANEIKADLISALEDMAADKYNAELKPEIAACVEFVNSCDQAARFTDNGKKIALAIRSDNVGGAMQQSIHLSGKNEANAFLALYDKWSDM